MKDESKPKKQLIRELMEYRQRVAKLEASEVLYKKVNENSDLLLSSKSQAKSDQYFLRENKEILEYLKKSRLFSHLPKRILEQLLPLSHLEDYPSGSEILIEGAINTKVFFLINGAVSVYAGGNKISELRRKGDIFGEMSIISNKPCSASIIAQTPVRLFSVKAKHIGEYTDIETNELDNILYRIFAMILTEKLSLTNKKAQQYETIHKDLLREIDERKLVEEKLQISQNTLEKRVEERTSELKSTNERLQREIEERKQAEETLQKSEERYRRLTENSPDMIYRMSLPDGKYEYVNPAAETIFGHPPQALFEEPLLIRENIHPDFTSFFEEQWENLLKGNVTPSYEYKIIRTDNCVRWINQRNIMVMDDAGNPVAIEGIVTDVTDRKSSEEALQKSEALLNATQRLTKVGGWEWDVEKQTIFWTDEIYRIHDFQRDEFLSDPTEQIERSIECYEPEDRPAIMDAFRNCIEKGQSYDLEFSFKTSKGRRIWVRTVAEAIIENNRVVKVIGNLMDISDRIQAEKILKESEERLAEAQRIACVGHYIVDISKDSWMSSHQLNDIFGIDKNLSKNTASWLQIIHPDHRETMSAYFQKNILTQHQNFDKEFKIINKRTGQEQWVHGLGKLKFDKSNNPVELFGTIQDITGRKRDEAILKNARKLWERTFDAISDWISIIDTQHTIIRSNNASKKLTGLSSQQIIGKRCYDIVHGTDCPIPGCPAGRAFISKQRESMEIQLKDGRWVRVTVDPIKGTPHGDDRFVHIVQDITDIKKREHAIIAVRKSEAFSILSGGIAHDYNNLLSVIWGNISLLREEITDPSTKDCFDEAEKACEQARSLTHQFLTLSPGAMLNKSFLSVKDLVNAAVEKTEDLNNIDLFFDIPDLLPPIEVDPDLMRIAIQNIIVNAAEAMPNGGKLEIRAETKSIENGVSGATKYLYLIFTDHGNGISAADLSQVFDPYFTTKERGCLKGMGLGLAVSQSIVIKHGGNIQICSAPEQGTSVLITLPLGLAGQESSRTENSGLLSDKPTILLLEDNPSLRKMCGQMLERLNCEVIYAGNGNEAIEKSNAAVKNKISIRLVLLDLNIKGGLGGIETLKRLRDSGYEKPVIVVSGTPDSPGIRDYQQFGFDGKLLRPYTKKELEKSIRQFIPF